MKNAVLTLKQGLEVQHYEVPFESRLIDVAEERDLPILFGCGQGVCGSCRVKVLEGYVAEPNEEEKDFLTALGCSPEERLACQLQIIQRLVIEMVE